MPKSIVFSMWQNYGLFLFLQFQTPKDEKNRYQHVVIGVLSVGLRSNTDRQQSAHRGH
jgi:hypothetical protein